ncbi:hypothetical protein PoB_007019500 [Plakobranchus ocellatus]|uniref:Uncharacterized protein n=1 Tax=Plakobranchus ocellatus TaxID=259542 RepID=A0AAV4DHT2_9GAST|nr:hypothetical protein PoB_007019500 [Plakobranchus ocellatus]
MRSGADLACPHADRNLFQTAMSQILLTCWPYISGREWDSEERWLTWAAHLLYERVDLLKINNGPGDLRIVGLVGFLIKMSKLCSVRERVYSASSVGKISCVGNTFGY